MASSTLVKVTACMAVMMLMMNWGVPMAEGFITCSQVQFTVAPCIGYLRGSGGAVTAPCCNGVRSLNNNARSTPDRQGVCRCLKTLAQTIPQLNLSNLASLPGKCGVNLPYTASPSIDCNKVK